MARLDGQKKSPLPLVLGIAALAALGAGGYYLYTQNQGVNSVVVSPNDIEAADNRSGLGENSEAKVQDSDASAKPFVSDSKILDEATPQATSVSSAASREVTRSETGLNSTAVAAETAAHRISPDGVGRAPVEAGGTENKMSGAASPDSVISSATKNETSKPVSAREKTIEKDGVKVTYRKEVTAGSSEKSATTRNTSETPRVTAPTGADN